MRFCIILVLALLPAGTQARDIKTGLFYGRNLESVVISVVEGEYTLTGDSWVITELTKGSIFHVDISQTGISVHDAEKSYGPFKLVSLIQADTSCMFLVRPVFPALPPKESDDRMDIIADGKYVKLINTLDIEKYISGVVEAEGGPNAMSEFYKAQAVLARTFAMKNFYRHAHEGFNVCDDVHCQAYKGKSRMNREIVRAVKLTNGLVLTGNDGEPLVTAYHACCGGITSSAAIEWNRHLDYLKPVADPFCHKSVNRNWNKSIPLSDWKAYLELIGYGGESDKLYKGETGRIRYLDQSANMPALTDIRKRFNLRSSWFHVEKQGNQVVFHGHGYGHGLGMCQEGAMEMARVGYTFIDILMFYYKNSRLTAGY